MKLYTAYTCGNASCVTPITCKDTNPGISPAVPRLLDKSPFNIFNTNTLFRINVLAPFNIQVRGIEDTHCIDNNKSFRINRFFKKNKIKIPG